MKSSIPDLSALSEAYPELPIGPPVLKSEMKVICNSIPSWPSSSKYCFHVFQPIGMLSCTTQINITTILIPKWYNILCGCRLSGVVLSSLWKQINGRGSFNTWAIMLCNFALNSVGSSSSSLQTQLSAKIKVHYPGPCNEKGRELREVTCSRHISLTLIYNHLAMNYLQYCFMIFIW